jgi:hypothetical protein
LLAIKLDQLRREVSNPTVEVLTTMDQLLKQIEQLSNDFNLGAPNYRTNPVLGLDISGKRCELNWSMQHHLVS